MPEISWFSYVKKFVDNNLGAIILAAIIIVSLTVLLLLLLPPYGVYKRDPVLAAGVHALAVIIPILTIYGVKKAFPGAGRPPAQIEATAEVPDMSDI